MWVLLLILTGDLNGNRLDKISEALKLASVRGGGGALVL